MPRYEVRIIATVEKTIVAEGDDQQEATESAHEQFSVVNNGTPEKYSQDTVSVRQLPEPPGKKRHKGTKEERYTRRK